MRESGYLAVKETHLRARGMGCVKVELTVGCERKGVVWTG